jgi:hypothetical protein
MNSTAGEGWTMTMGMRLRTYRDVVRGFAAVALGLADLAVAR